jgi:hypothetical protein
MTFDAKYWAKVQAFYEGGYSLGQITSRPDVIIKDRSLISKRARKEGWQQGQISILVNLELAINKKNELKKTNPRQAGVFADNSTGISRTCSYLSKASISKYERIKSEPFADKRKNS